MSVIPADYEDLLIRPLFGHLATTRPDGTTQVSPMWFDWDGRYLRFTHTTKRQRYRNVSAHPEVALSVADPDNPYRYLEVRGVVDRIDPDPAAAFFLQLNSRYQGPVTAAPDDAPDRVVIVVRPTAISKQ